MSSFTNAIIGVSKAVHAGTYWEGSHDGDGFLLPLCAQAGYSYETKHTKDHQAHVARETDKFRVTCKKCLKKLKAGNL